MAEQEWQRMAHEHEQSMLERAARGFEAAATLIDDAVEELGTAAKALVAGDHDFSLDGMSVLKTCQELAAQQARAVRQHMADVAGSTAKRVSDPPDVPPSWTFETSADLVCMPLPFLEHVLAVVKDPEATRQAAEELVGRLEAFLGNDAPPAFEIKPDVRVDRYVGGRCPSCGRSRLELYVDGTETGVTVPRAVGVRCEKCFTTWILDPALATVYGDHDDRGPLRPAHDNDYGLGT
jgi:hypothetical protein